MHRHEKVTQNTDVGKALRLRRLALRLSQQQVAEATGISTSLMSRIEQGKRNPSGRTLQRLSKSLHLVDSDLLSLAGYRSPPSEVSKQAPVVTRGQVDPYIAGTLGGESREVQYAVIGLLAIINNVQRALSAPDREISPGNNR